MKKRILSILCAVLIVATMLTFGAVSSFAAAIVLDEPLSKGFNKTEWNAEVSADLVNDQTSGDISTTSTVMVDNRFGTGTTKVYTVSSKDTYDLTNGFIFESKLTFSSHISNYYGEYNSMYVGPIGSGLELRIKNTASQNKYNAYIYFGGEQLASYDLASAPNGEYAIKYENSKVSVTLKDEPITWTTASGTVTEIALAGADFSNTTIGFRIAPNWSNDANFRKWAGIYLEALAGSYSSIPASSTPVSSTLASSEPASSEPASAPVSSTSASSEPVSSAPASSTAPAVGEAITPVVDGAITKTDWEGDTKRIDNAGGFAAPDQTKNTITTVKTYDLSGGFKFSSKLTFQNHFSNYYGEYASMYVGDPETGLELRIQQDKEGRGNAALYNGYLLYNGAKIATADLLNAPNGVWEITYKDGKVSVTLKDTAVTWTLNDKSTATSVTLDSPDFKAAKLGLHIEGNWGNGYRNWKNYSINTVSGSGGQGGSGGAGGVGGTGDARELVVPAVAIVLGACAVAFVVKSRKAEA